MTMATKVACGEMVDFTPTTGDVAAGDVVLRGESVQVALTPIGNNALGALAVEGVFDFNKSNLNMPIGDGNMAYWDGTNGTVTSVSNATPFKKIGPAIGAVGANDTVARILLRPN